MVEFTCSAGDLGSIPGFGRCPGEGHGYPLQYSCLENPMDRGAWWATAYGVRHDRDSHLHFTCRPVTSVIGKKCGVKRGDPDTPSPPPRVWR